MNDLTPEQQEALAHVEDLLNKHFARLESRRREPFNQRKGDDDVSLPDSA